MRVAVLEQLVVPTARAVRWTPLIGVSALLLAVTLLARTASRPADLVAALASAALACVVVASLHDPAAALLAAVPVSSMQRRGLRLGLALTPALACWALLARVSDTSPGTGSPWPMLALTAAGVAVAVWSPPHRGLLVATSLPLLWFAFDMTVPGTGTLADLAGLWHTAPGAVLGVALLGLLAGRRR
jgi:hypothetical protein